MILDTDFYNRPHKTVQKNSLQALVPRPSKSLIPKVLIQANKMSVKFQSWGSDVIDDAMSDALRSQVLPCEYSYLCFSCGPFF
jgi:hypothetical protein